MTDGPGPLAALRAAGARLEADTATAGDIDPARDADRFEAVHDALVAVLADIDDAGGAPPDRA